MTKQVHACAEVPWTFDPQLELKQIQRAATMKSVSGPFRPHVFCYLCPVAVKLAAVIIFPNVKRAPAGVDSCCAHVPTADSDREVGPRQDQAFYHVPHPDAVCAIVQRQEKAGNEERFFVGSWWRQGQLGS